MSTRVQGSGVRAGCEGVVALDGRLEPWQQRLCRRPELLRAWLDEHGSPVNVLDPAPLARNAAALTDAAAAAGLDLGIYFARKANKALAFVDAAHALGLGVDLASERELVQVLDRGVPGSALVMTAAVKPAALLARCVASGTTVVVDNTDELDALAATAARGVEVSADAATAPRTRVEEGADAATAGVGVEPGAAPASPGGEKARVALRLAPDLGGDCPQTRFGFELDEAIAVAGDGWPAGLAIDGVHFHLDGYNPGERVLALGQALRLVDALRDNGHEPSFVDIGGGIPMSYLDSAPQWEHFWAEHRKALLGEREPLTFDGHGLGLLAHDGEILGRPAVYPFHQRLTGAAWLTEVLSGEVEPGRSAAAALRERGVQLRCEPGRALLDGCGLTVARVAYRKQRRDGTWLIGVEMNRTQCRSTSEDFLVDPLLLEGDAGREPTGEIEGFLVGAYCIERELLTWRRLRFPHGVQVGDLVVFPNTAGYLMHILESSSHQIPLARNLIVGPDLVASLDPIDVGP